MLAAYVLRHNHNYKLSLNYLNLVVAIVLYNYTLVHSCVLYCNNQVTSSFNTWHCTTRCRLNYINFVMMVNIVHTNDSDVIDCTVTELISHA